ncbi:11263_t:CDS:2 [Diversispora eburnea]|uniref:11263_t:CDS:1 n=1 Tax=Diversispora eburnea TaxID=1213867 RepID=A0A9N8VYG7_9GLOM|nr:11263_t:CDS:2 [Diversispora eburnea]
MNSIKSSRKIRFNFPTLNMLREDYLAKLATEMLYEIINFLDDDDKKNLSLSCKWLYRVLRKFEFGFVAPYWDPITIEGIDEKLLTLNYRNGVWIDGIFYLIIFSKDNPICWTLDLRKEHIVWSQAPVTLEMNSNFEPIRKFSATSVGNSIYIFGGENIETNKFTNVFYEFDTRTYVMRILNSIRTPAARKNHSLNAIEKNRLVMFGGRCLTNEKGNSTSQEMYDTQDFFFYDIKEKTWTSYTDTSNLPFRRSSHCSIVVNNDLYLYGGKQINSNSTSQISQIHDDNDIYVYNFPHDNWHKYLAPSPNGTAISTFLLPINWIATSGVSVGRRKRSAIFTMQDHIIIFGGYERDDWNFENENCPWEFIKLLAPEKCNWKHIRVKNLPRINCIAYIGEYRSETKGIFVIGKDREKKPVIGWIKDSIIY